MEDGVSNSSINRELTCLKRTFSLAITWGESNINPVKDIKFLEGPPRPKRFLSENEAQRLIDCGEIFTFIFSLKKKNGQ